MDWFVYGSDEVERYGICDNACLYLYLRIVTEHMLKLEKYGFTKG